MSRAVVQILVTCVVLVLVNLVVLIVLGPGMGAPELAVMFGISLVVLVVSARSALRRAS